MLRTQKKAEVDQPRSACRASLDVTVLEMISQPRPAQPMSHVELGQEVSHVFLREFRLS